MPILLQCLASGSKGNATLVCSAKTRVLFDAGLSAKELSVRLNRTSIQAKELDAIIISHEHLDHVRGLGTFSRRYGLPVFLSQGTLDHLPPEVGELPHIQVFNPGTAFAVGDLKVQPFAVSHDAGEPAGFVVEHQSTRLGMCTDLGVATELVKMRLADCHALFVEANHDLDLLLNGPYPWPLKQRIRSRHGHLSNTDTCELLECLYHEDLQTVLFAHLSEVNNNPERVLQTSRDLLKAPHWSSVAFAVVGQHSVSRETVLDSIGGK